MQQMCFEIAWRLFMSGTLVGIVSFLFYNIASFFDNSYAGIRFTGDKIALVFEWIFGIITAIALVAVFVGVILFLISVLIGIWAYPM